jgi:hypothetical protein
LPFQTMSTYHYQTNSRYNNRKQLSLIPLQQLSLRTA